jgi:hypothetical protein
MALADLLVAAGEDLQIRLNSGDALALASYVLAELHRRQYVKARKPSPTYTDADVELMTKNGLWHE